MKSRFLPMAALCACAAVLPPPQADAQDLEVLDLRDVPLGVAARALTEVSGINLVPSAEAAKTNVSLYLREVSARDAIENLCRSNDFWHREEPGSRIVRVHTPAEYQRNLSGFREESTEVFDLKYPNAHDVAKAIRNLYGSRVLVNLEEQDDTSVEELRQRFERFDEVDERSQGIGFDGVGGSASGGSRSGSSGRYGRSGSSRYGRSSSSGGSARRAQDQAPLDPQRIEGLTAEEIQRLEAEIAAERDMAIQELVDDRADIFVNIIQRLNKVMVRTRDQATMDQIRDLIRRIDVPTTSVMLEVKIYSVTLTDSMSSAVDYLFSNGQITAGFGTGAATEGNFTFQFIDDTFSVRLQALQEKGRARLVSSPNLLTANNEVSRLFVGEERSILRGFSGSQIVQSSGGNTVVRGEPEYETRPVGSTLLITPNINTDGTLTLRLLQENSSIAVGGSTVLVPFGEGYESVDIDTVQARSMTGTVVARDRVPVVIGGLINTTSVKSREQVPVLGEIPVVGGLFGNRRKSESHEELVLVILPRIVHPDEGGLKASEEWAAGNDVGLHDDEFAPYPPGDSARLVAQPVDPKESVEEPKFRQKRKWNLFAPRNRR